MPVTIARNKIIEMPAESFAELRWNHNQVVLSGIAKISGNQAAKNESALKDRRLDVLCEVTCSVIERHRNIPGQCAGLTKINMEQIGLAVAVQVANKLL